MLRDDPYFDLIITDIMMPYMTGFDFTRKSKENPRTQGIPVIGTSPLPTGKRQEMSVN